MLYILPICQFILAISFGWSVLRKWRHLRVLALALHQSQISPQLVRFITLSILPIEAGLAILLILAAPNMLPSVMMTVTALLIIFTAWQGWVLVNKFHIACGCFGPSAIATNIWSVLRNIILIGIACTGFIFSLMITSPISVAPLWLILSSLLVVMSGTMLKIIHY